MLTAHITEHVLYYYSRGKVLSTLIIVDLIPTDTERLAGETVTAHGGVFLATGAIESLHGDAPFTTKVVIQFPDRDSALKWYHCPDYQALIPTRERGMNSPFHLVG